MATFVFPKKSIVLVGGVPGSGKSHLLDRVKTPEGTFVTSADHIRGLVQRHHGKDYHGFYREHIPEAREVFFGALQKAVDDGDNIINEGTYLSLKSIREMVTWGEQRGYTTSMLLVKARLGQCLEGVADRERKVPLKNLIAYWRSFRGIETALLNGQVSSGLSGVTIVRREDPVEGLYFT